MFIDPPDSDDFVVVLDGLPAVRNDGNHYRQTLGCATKCFKIVDRQSKVYRKSRRKEGKEGHGKEMGDLIFII